MRLFASVVTVVALCGACREREPSPKELEVQLAQAKARQAEAEAEKAAIEARTNHDVLAGSLLRMDQAVRNLVAFTRCSWEDAVHAASTTPARLLRRHDLGRLEPGCAGDVVLLDEEGGVVATVIGGHVAFDRDGRVVR